MTNYHNVIYIMTNKSFPGWVKFGWADDLIKRRNGLNSSSATPFPFEVYAVYETNVCLNGANERLKDLKLHELIDGINPTLRARGQLDGRDWVREFYSMTPEEAYKILACIATISGTQERLHRINDEREVWMKHVDLNPTEEDCSIIAKTIVNQKAPRFRFSMCRLHPGDIITLDGHSEVQARIINDTRVEYQGRIMCLSPLTKQLKGLARTPQGPAYWRYHGELLTDLRARMEEVIEVNDGVHKSANSMSKECAVQAPHTDTECIAPMNPITPVENTSYRAPRFRFSMCQLRAGDIIVLDGYPEIQATIIDDTRVEYQGYITYLSPLTQKLKGFAWAPQGPAYWRYHGELLTDRRLRLEGQE